MQKQSQYRLLKQAVLTRTYPRKAAMLDSGVVPLALIASRKVLQFSLPCRAA